METCIGLTPISVVYVLNIIIIIIIIHIISFTILANAVVRFPLLCFVILQQTPIFL